MRPLLQLKDITKTFGAIRALGGVSFEVCPGEVHALLGENGAGKSTLIKVITGAHQPDRGTIDVDGQSFSSLSPAAAQVLGIAAIYQQPALFPDLTVAENIALGSRRPRPFSRVDWRGQISQARQWLDRIGARINPETEIRELSMPEQQLVEIAKALGAGARLLIMDEPTASLTHQEVSLLLSLTRELRRKGTSVIYISHRLDEIFEIADRVTVLRDGKTVGTRTVRTTAPLSPDSAVKGKEGTQLTREELIQMMVGREVASVYPPSEAAPGAAILSVQNLACAFSGIHDVSFKIRAGEVLGLAGLVGSGRTELARILFGITPASNGAICLQDRCVTIRSPRDAIKAGIAYVPEDRRRHGVILPLPVAFNISMSVHEQLFPRGVLRFRKETQLADEFIASLSIKTPSGQIPAASLSGGNQQKVALSRWLATEPKVLILDEPTQGVDVGAKAEIHKIIRRLAARGMAVLMISSDLSEIMGMSDRIAVMREGALQVILPADASAGEIMSHALGHSVPSEVSNESPP